MDRETEASLMRAMRQDERQVDLDNRQKPPHLVAPDYAAGVEEIREHLIYVNLSDNARAVLDKMDELT